MSKQNPGSPAAESLRDFMTRTRACPPEAEEILDRFVGFRIAGVEFLYKKIEYSLQRGHDGTRETQYPGFYSGSALCPLNLQPKPGYVIFHSTDSRKAKNLNQEYGETFFFTTAEQLEARLGCPLEHKRRVTASLAKREKLGEELSANELRLRLNAFLTNPSRVMASVATESTSKSGYKSVPMDTAGGKVVTIGVTGASGAIYAQTILRVLDADARVEHVYFVASDAGLRLIATELGIVAQEPKKLPGLLTGTAAKKIELLPNRDVGAAIASGSSLVDGMVVIPCSAGALGAISSGTSDDLLTRAADVCLKERRKLVLCLRETPLNRIHLENMLRVHDAGAVVMPAMPAFYYAPKQIDDMVEQFVYRVLAQLGLPHAEQYRWQGGARGVKKA